MAYPAPTSPVYRNTRHGFVVYGPAELIALGSTEVHLKSGKKKFEMIRGLGAIFKADDGVSVRYGYLTENTSGAAGSGNKSSEQNGEQFTGRAGTSTLSQLHRKADLDAEDFMPDSAYSGEESYVPAGYEE